MSLLGIYTLSDIPDDPCDAAVPSAGAATHVGTSGVFLQCVYMDDFPLQHPARQPIQPNARTDARAAAVPALHIRPPAAPASARISEALPRTTVGCSLSIATQAAVL